MIKGKYREEYMSKKDLNELKEATLKAEMSQRGQGDQEGKDKPSSDLYGDVEKRDEDTGVEVPTLDSVNEAKDWSEENQM